MTPMTVLRGFFALLFSGIFAWMVFDRADGGLDGDRQKYLPYIPGSLLPGVFVGIIGVGYLWKGAAFAVQTTLDFCFGVFLHICLYYLLLMPLLPLLRRHISARACAVLWMLPNYLYLTQMNYMRVPAPRWVVVAPARLVKILLLVWVTGFTAVLGWKTLSHLILRARILRPAVPVTDAGVLEVWYEEVGAARFEKQSFYVVRSPAVAAPLSVGLFRRSIRVVLPEREYTREELALIFRHELVHIGREDAWNKFFLVFCTALCWFNPLMWIAMKKSSEDLELSCDETVLLGAGEATKRRYADLLLKTAGEERGYTTCLSASAEALRYRLKSVVGQKKKPSGALTVGLVFFVLSMSSGYVALAYGEATGAEAIYNSQTPETYNLRTINTGSYVCTDEEALGRYLSEMRMEHISGNYSFEEEGERWVLLYETPRGTLGVVLSDRFIELVPLYEGKITAEYYYLPDGTDWAVLEGLVEEGAYS